MELPPEPGASDDERVAQAGIARGGTQAIFVWFEIVELERIRRDQVFRILIKTAVVGQGRDAVGRAHPEMERAFGAYLQAVLQDFGLQNLTALRAFDPETFRHFGSPRSGLGDLRLDARRLEIIKPWHSMSRT